MSLGTIQRVEKHIARERLLHNGDKLLVGLSGGPDSVALLHMLLRLRPLFGWVLHVVHCNHQIRASAETDERFVQTLCRKWALPLTIRRFRFASGQAASLEQRAREKRLKVFGSLSGTLKADAVVLGHHRDDQAETILMHILRGSGLLGLQGLLPCTFIDGIRITRPLLCLGREEILKYLKVNHLRYRNDPTNRDTHFLRNRIRRQLIPGLQRHYQPNIAQRLADLSQNTAIDYQFLLSCGEKILSNQVKRSNNGREGKIRRAAFLRLDPCLQRMLLRLIVREITGDMNKITCQQVSSAVLYATGQEKKGSCPIVRGLTLIRTPDELLIKRKA